jgi:hypothetical protein
MKDYLNRDQLTVVVNGAANTIAALNVATYLDKPDDSGLDVQFASLPDGAGCRADDPRCKAKDIRVVIQNTGHRPIKPAGREAPGDQVRRAGCGHDGGQGRSGPRAQRAAASNQPQKRG